MHNDISFLIDVQDLYTEMNLYEEQSYFCPNMPLQKLQYAGNLYEKYLVDHKLNKYGRTQLKLPVPRLVTFYIGTEDKPDETIRENTKVMVLEEAVDRTIDEMPDGYVLKKVLVLHRTDTCDYPHGRPVKKKDSGEIYSPGSFSLRKR